MGLACLLLEVGVLLWLQCQPKDLPDIQIPSKTDGISAKSEFVDLDTHMKYERVLYIHVLNTCRHDRE